MKYIGAKAAAERWGISPRRVQVLCEQNRIKGVFRLGNAWAIPEKSEKPIDGRTKQAAVNRSLEEKEYADAGMDWKR